MARPGWPERTKAARSLGQFKRFRHVINSDKLFGTHNRFGANELVGEGPNGLARERLAKGRARSRNSIQQRISLLTLVGVRFEGFQSLERVPKLFQPSWRSSGFGDRIRRRAASRSRSVSASPVWKSIQPIVSAKGAGSRRRASPAGVISKASALRRNSMFASATKRPSPASRSQLRCDAGRRSDIRLGSARPRLSRRTRAGRG